MIQTLRNLSLILFILLFFSNETKAQTEGNAIKASIGFASSGSYYIENYGAQDEVDVMGGGLYL